MDNNQYKEYLKQAYFQKIHERKPINTVVSLFQEKLDIVETTLSESEMTFFKLYRISCLNSLVYSVNKNNIGELNFVSYELLYNDKSKRYYDYMADITVDNERIIIIVETQLNDVTSNCHKLADEMKIVRGIEQHHVVNETPELFAYLMLFDI